MSEHRLFGFLGERSIDLEHLDTPVRRVIFTTAAVLMSLALATALRGAMAVGAPYKAFFGFAFPPVVAWISGASVSLAAILVLAGAAGSRSRWRYVLIALPIWAALLCEGNIPPGGLAAAAGMILPVLFGAGCIFLASRRLRISQSLELAAAIVLAFVLAAIFLSLAAWPPYAPTALLAAGIVGVFALHPTLMVVGADVAEIGGAAALRAWGWLSRRLPDRGAAARWLAVAIALGVVAALMMSLGAGGASMIFPASVFAVLALAGLALAGAVAFAAGPGGGRVRLGFATMLLCAVPAYLPTVAPFTEPDPAYYNYDFASHEFSLKLPRGMKVWDRRPEQPRTSGDFEMLFRMAGKRPPTLFVFAWHRPPFSTEPAPATINQLAGLSTFSAMPLTLGPETGGWRQAAGEASSNARGVRVHFRVWEREEDTTDKATSMNWYIVCGDVQSKSAATDALCETVRGTFHSVPADRIWTGGAAAIDAFYWLLAVGALILLAQRMKLIGAAVFLYWILWITATRDLDLFAFGRLDTDFGDSRFVTTLLAAVIAAGAIAVSALQLLRLDRFEAGRLEHARQIAARGLISVAAVGLFYLLYVFAASRSETSQWVRAMIVGLALTWELVSAGETLNPTTEHHAFSRNARVLIFAGYLVTVATCVFLFGAMRLPWGDINMGAYDTETIVAEGIVVLGTAFWISRIVPAVAGLLKQAAAAQPAPTADAAHPDAAPAEGAG